MLHATSDRVAVEWLKTRLGLGAFVATTLPKDNTTWAGTGFVQVTPVGGAPDMYIPVRRVVVQIDCWAVVPNSGKPPWWSANQLAEQVVACCYDLEEIQSLVVTGAGYTDARVLSAYVLSEPRRMYDDDGSYAHYQFDVQLHWVEVP